MLGEKPSRVVGICHMATLLLTQLPGAATSTLCSGTFLQAFQYQLPLVQAIILVLLTISINRRAKISVKTSLIRTFRASYPSSAKKLTTNRLKLNEQANSLTLQ